jgi:hypothetical protein
MMFQLGSLLGIILGYFLCIGHAKLTLAIHRHSPEGRREETDRHPGLIRTRRCPTGFSAAQVLGYHQIGRPDMPPLFDGGLDEWPY